MAPSEPKGLKDRVRNVAPSLAVPFVEPSAVLTGGLIFRGRDSLVLGRSPTIPDRETLVFRVPPRSLIRKVRQESGSSLIQMRKVRLVEVAPNLCDLLNRRCEVTVIVDGQRKRNGPAALDLREKHVHRLRRRHTELVENFFHASLAARVNPGAEDGSC